MERARTTGLSNFEMDTVAIPAGVDIELATRRTELIEAWREGGGSVKSEDTLRKLLELYLSTQETAAIETRGYLLQSLHYFPAEAGIPMDATNQILYEVMQES